MARIGIDLDGCVYPFAQEFTKYASRRMGVELPLPDHWFWYTKKWAITHQQFRDLLVEALLDGEIWSNADPIPGAVGALWQLSDMGHRIIIATDRLQQTEHERKARAVTRLWLQRAGINYDDLIFTSDKRDADVEVFLEDRPGAVPTLRLAGVDAIYYTQPYNEWFPYPRVSSWPEFVEYVGNRYEP